MKTRFGEEHATSRADAIGIDALPFGRGGWLLDGVCLAGSIDRHGVYAHCVGHRKKFLIGSAASRLLPTLPSGHR